METLDSKYVLLKDTDTVTRSEFIRKTYRHLAIAVLAFIVIEAILINMPFANNLAALMMGSQISWLVVLGGFMLVTRYAEKMATETHDIKKQYTALGIYVLAQAVVFMPLILIASLMEGGGSIMSQAAFITIALFIGLSLVVLTTGKDFSFLRGIITIGGVVALGLIVAGAIFGFDLGLAFSGGMVVLASASILYQTSNMAHKYSTDQHVAASLGLFASVMLLFWYILQILMSRD